MDRRVDELEYVRDALHRSRQEVAANPGLFEPDALERIDKAIAAIEEEMQVKAA